MKPQVHSYYRFSHPDQAKGDSVRRQVALAEDYCRRRGWTLDDSLTIKDLGVPAFKGENAVVGNFRSFLDAIKSGRVASGSILLVESFDRITRQGIDEGYDLIKGILKSGVRIVTLSPEREFDQDAVRSLSKGSLEIQLILERAAEESERKSARVAAAWNERRRKTRAGGDTLTNRLPTWIEIRDGERALIAEKAAVIKRIFELAGAGYGTRAIRQKLTEENVTGDWSRSYIARLLNDRRVLGEFQPHSGRHKTSKPVGDPIKDYFPALVTKAEWERARAGAQMRRTSPGRIGRHVNLFSRLIWNARTEDDPYYIETREGGRRRLVNAKGADSDGTKYTFPADIFEAVFIGILRDKVNPKEVFGQDKAPDEVSVLTDKLTQTEAAMAYLIKNLDQYGESPTIYSRLRDKETERAELIGLLEEAKTKAAVPLAVAWDEVKSLSASLSEAIPTLEELLEEAKTRRAKGIKPLDDALRSNEDRMRLRSAIRRVTESIYLLVIPTGGRRYLGVFQVFFKESPRSWLGVIEYWTAHGPSGQGRRWESSANNNPLGVDLRKPDTWNAEAWGRGINKHHWGAWL